MVRRKVCIFIVASIVGLGGLALAGRMISGGGEEVARDLVAGGGGRGTNDSGLVLEGSICQSVAAVSRSTDDTVLVGGFQTMNPSPPSSGAKNWALY
jgi:hypothetical protein